MPQLTSLVGRSVFVRSHVLDEEKPVLVKIVDVEESGLWIEWQAKTDEILQLLNVQTAPRTPIFFLPFAQIAWLHAWLEMPSLSEKGFGVDAPDQPPKG